MLSLNIKISGLNDPPAFPEVKACEEAEIHGVVILQGGMTSGKEAVGIMIKAKNGQFFFVQTSGDLIVNGLTPAITGAQARWQEKPHNN